MLKILTILGGPNAIPPREETRCLQTEAELTAEERNYYETDGLAMQQILLGIPKNIFASVDS